MTTQKPLLAHMLDASGDKRGGEPLDMSPVAEGVQSPGGNLVAASTTIGYLQLAGRDLTHGYKVVQLYTAEQLQAARAAAMEEAAKIAEAPIPVCCGCFQHEPNSDSMEICCGQPDTDYLSPEQCAAAIRAATKESAPAMTETAKDKADAERLDFVLTHGAFMQKAHLDHPGIRWQLMVQDEDEVYHAISGENKSFATPREAIDAAIAAGGAR